MRHLSKDAKRLFRAVEKEGTVRTDRPTLPLRLDGKVGDAARELEKRLLVHGDEVHTEMGGHAMILSSWPTWSATMGLEVSRIGAGAAKARFEALLESLNQEYDGSGRLPWVSKEKGPR